MKIVAPKPEEVLRYLGVAAPDTETLRLVDESIALLCEQAEARFVHRLFEITVQKGSVQLLDRVMISESLSSHMAGCAHAVLFAMTLGASVDRLIARYAQTNIAMAAGLQAAAAAAVEAACDDFCSDLATQAQSGALTGFSGYLTARFSPGYGDFPLHYQKDVLELLNAPIRIGLTTTESFMLAPSKSVTAFVGVSPVPVKSCYGECALCGKHDCAFRRNIPSTGVN